MPSRKRSRKRHLNLTREVSDSLFQEHEFFDSRDLLQVKYEMLHRVQVEGWPVKRAAETFGFSRPAFIMHMQLRPRGGCGLLPHKRGPHGAHKLSEEVMEFVELLSEDETITTNVIVTTFRTSRRYFFGNFSDVRLIISNYTKPSSVSSPKNHQTRKCWTRKKSKPHTFLPFKNNIFKLKIILALRCSLSDSYKTDFTPSQILQDHQKKLDTQLALVIDILSALFMT